MQAVRQETPAKPVAPPVRNTLGATERPVLELCSPQTVMTQNHLLGNNCSPGAAGDMWTQAAQLLTLQ